MLWLMLVLLYHGVRPKGDTVSPDIRHKHVPEQAFAQQLDILKRSFKVIPLSEAVARLRDKKPLPKNACVITFDDGYANNAETAAPLLKARGLPATFFVTTDFIDGSMQLWVDRFELAYSKISAGTDPSGDAKERERLKKLPTDERERLVTELEQRAGTVGQTALLHRAMSWNQVRGLIRHGFEIGAHTKTHPILSRCSSEQIRDEVVGSKHKIEQELGRPCLHFASPNGQPDDWNDEVLSVIKQNFASLSTTISRFAKDGDDPFLIPRITIDTGEDMPKFLLTVSGIRTMLQGIKRRL